MKIITQAWLPEFTWRRGSEWSKRKTVEDTVTLTDHSDPPSGMKDFVPLLLARYEARRQLPHLYNSSSCPAVASIKTILLDFHFFQSILLLISSLPFLSSDVDPWILYKKAFMFLSISDAAFGNPNYNICLSSLLLQHSAYFFILALTMLYWNNYFCMHLLHWFSLNFLRHIFCIFFSLGLSTMVGTQMV